MLYPQSQLLLRNINDLTGKILLIEPMADQLAFELADAKLDITCLTSDVAVANAWQGKIPTTLSHDFVLDAVFDTVVVFFPKSKELLHYLLARIKPFLHDNSNVYLVGDNKGGIKSLAALAEKLGLHAHKLDNAKHCLWFALNGLGEQTLKASTMAQFAVNHGVFSFPFCSLPGVFNHGQLDQGSALLLENLGHVQQGTVLDFACGAGLIGTALKLREPKIQLFASDISALAVASTEATFALNKLQAQVQAADGIPTSTPAFDHIVSNPPFHTGLKTDLSIAEQFIRDSKAKLKTNGSLTLVANAHLPYAEWLTAAFGNVKELARRQGFVVYRSIKN